MVIEKYGQVTHVDVMNSVFGHAATIKKAYGKGLDIADVRVQ